MNSNHDFKSGYAAINGLKMYYEIYGEADGEANPLVLIHGGGSTIQTSFGRIIPQLAKNRQIIGVELQAHGHTNDRDTDLSFEQDAADVAALLENLGISKADILGFSNGASTAIELAIRWPGLVHKIILASGLYKRSGTVPGFWEGFKNATLENMPQVLQDGYLRANNSEQGLLNMFHRDVQRMKAFEDYTDAQIGSIKVPALVMSGNQDVGSLEHAVEIYRLIPDSELAILPGGHGGYMGTLESMENGTPPKFMATGLIEAFLDK